MSLHEDVAPADYWSLHAEAWGHIADAENYVGDLPAEDFFSDLWEAANWVSNTYFN